MALPKPTVHDPATYWQAYYLGGEGRTRASAYVCYAIRGCPTNGAGSKPGRGATEREALLDACYWQNQGPWVRVVPESKAPQWALEELAQSEDHNQELTAAWGGDGTDESAVDAIADAIKSSLAPDVADQHELVDVEIENPSGVGGVIISGPAELAAKVAMTIEEDYASSVTPRGAFREGHDGELACMHRDVSCCDRCRDAYPEIVEVYGVCYWIEDAKERASLRLALRREPA